MKILTAAMAATLLSVSPATAQDRTPDENQTAFAEMMAGDYDAAEKKLLESARTNVGARINLAQIFARQGKMREALVLLRSVKDNDDIALEGVEGDILSSHQVADVLMQRMGARDAMAAAETR